MDAIVNNQLISRIHSVMLLKNARLYIYGVIILILFFLSFYYVNNRRPTNASLISNTNSLVKTQIANPVASQDINKTFTFPLNDTNGNIVSNISYKILSAELRDQIVIKGQPVMPIAGKTFLVINLELTNDYDKSVQINTRDYIRILRNSSDERLAADINNDPVEDQAISTVQTRLAMAINTSDKNLKMEVGEIAGSKTSIPLTLQYNK